MIPVPGNGLALQDRGADGSYCEHDQSGEEPPHKKLKPFIGENTEVKGQDRNLGEVHRQLVSNLTSKESLTDISVRLCAMQMMRKAILSVPTAIVPLKVT